MYTQGNCSQCAEPICAMLFSASSNAGQVQGMRHACVGSKLDTMHLSHLVHACLRHRARHHCHEAHAVHMVCAGSTPSMYRQYDIDAKVQAKILSIQQQVILRPGKPQRCATTVMNLMRHVSAASSLKAANNSIRIGVWDLHCRYQAPPAMLSGPGTPLRTQPVRFVTCVIQKTCGSDGARMYCRVYHAAGQQECWRMG